MKELSLPEIKSKIESYCAYQERSHQEVRKKLLDLGARGNHVDEIITELITSNFLNEERYARAYAGGKFRMKKWGRLKIVQGLEAQNVSANCIRIALKELDENDYLATLSSLVEKKAEEIDEENLFVKRDKLSKYAIQKGYEPDLVWPILKSLFPDQR